MKSAYGTIIFSSKLPSLHTCSFYFISLFAWLVYLEKVKISKIYTLSVLKEQLYSKDNIFIARERIRRTPLNELSILHHSKVKLH